jgi:hypothetical protein
MWVKNSNIGRYLYKDEPLGFFFLNSPDPKKLFFYQINSQEKTGSGMPIMEFYSFATGTRTGLL